MKNRFVCALLSSTLCALTTFAFDYENVGRMPIPAGNDPAAFHYDKMMGALVNGKVRLANAHARARIPHMALTYRSVSLRNYLPSDLQEPSIKAEAIIDPENPPEIKLEALPIQFDLDSGLNEIIDFKKEADRFIDESTEMLKSLQAPAAR